MQVGERRQHVDSDMEEGVDARRRQLVTRFARVTGESHEIRTGSFQRRGRPCGPRAGQPL